MLRPRPQNHPRVGAAHQPPSKMKEVMCGRCLLVLTLTWGIAQNRLDLGILLLYHGFVTNIALPCLTVAPEDQKWSLFLGKYTYVAVPSRNGTLFHCVYISTALPWSNCCSTEFLLWAELICTRLVPRLSWLVRRALERGYIDLSGIPAPTMCV